MRKAEAEYFIERAAANQIPVAISNHFWDEAEVRAPGLTVLDVYEMLRRGSVFGAPVHEPERLCHKVRIRATLPDFGPLEIVVAIVYADDSIVCITIY